MYLFYILIQIQGFFISKKDQRLKKKIVLGINDKYTHNRHLILKNIKDVLLPGFVAERE